MQEPFFLYRLKNVSTTFTEHKNSLFTNTLLQNEKTSQLDIEDNELIELKKQTVTFLFGKSMDGGNIHSNGWGPEKIEGKMPNT